jgi:N-methylhydantoinase A
VHSVAGTTHLRDEWKPAAKPALIREARVLLPELRASVEAAVYDRVALKAGDTFSGPSIIEQDDTTTLVTPGWHCRVDKLGNLMLERAATGPATDRKRT